MKNKTNLGETLYYFRKKASLSQEELAEKLDVSRQSISKWECGESLPDTENLIALSQLYEISLDELVQYTAKPSPLILHKDAEYIEDEDEDEKTIANKAIHILRIFPYPVLIFIAFLLWGFIWDGWIVAWTLFLTTPIYYSIIHCLRTNSLKHFNYPVLITFIYLFLGMQWGWWHPHWILFLTTPVYYAIIKCIEDTK